MKNIIKRIAKEFNKKEVVWAIGGSYLLKRYGIKSISSELDIMVSEESITNVLEIMEILAVKQKSVNSENFQTDFFEVYLVGGKTVNIISNLKSDFQEKFTYDFSKKDINIHELYDGESIYYGYLMDWYLIYCEIDLRDELSSVEEYYLNGGFFNNNRFVEKFRESNHALIDFNYSNLKSKIYMNV